MEFVLNEYHRNTSDEELIADVKQVAELLHQNTLTQKDYKQYDGKFHPATIARRIGSWNEVLKKAGLALERTNLYKRHEYCESDEAFFEDLRRIAKEMGITYVTTGVYEEKGRYAYTQIKKRYHGWNGLLRAAGLESTPFRNGPSGKYSNKELFEEMDRMWMKLGHQPKYDEARNSNEFRISADTYANHFEGSWRKALKAFLDYKNSNKIGNNTKDYDLPQPANNKTSKGLKHELLKGINRNCRREPTEKQKRLVLERDGNCCRLCGVPCNDGINNIRYDHIIPWAKGGRTDIDNLQVLCEKCNAIKSDSLKELEDIIRNYEQGREEEVVKILEDAKQKTINKGRGWLEYWLKIELNIYQITGDKMKQRDAAYELFVCAPSLEYYKLLKELVSKEYWKDYLAQMINDTKDNKKIGPRIEADIYVSENDENHLLQLLMQKENRDLNFFDEYSPNLKNIDLKGLLVEYTRLCKEYAEKSNKHGHYIRLRNTMSIMQKLQGGNTAVHGLAEYLRVTYKRRKSLIMEIENF